MEDLLGNTYFYQVFYFFDNDLWFYGVLLITIFEGEEYSYAIYDGAVWHPKKSNIRGLYRIFEDRDENIWFTTFLR